MRGTAPKEQTQAPIAEQITAQMGLSGLGTAQLRVHAACCWSHGSHLSHYGESPSAAVDSSGCVPPFLLYILGRLTVQKASECCLNRRHFSLWVVESHRQLGTVLEARTVLEGREGSLVSLGCTIRLTKGFSSYKSLQRITQGKQSLLSLCKLSSTWGLRSSSFLPTQDILRTPIIGSQNKQTKPGHSGARL